MADGPSFKKDDQITNTSPTLLEKVKGNDESAWKRLVYLYEPIVIRWSRQFGLDHHESENISQDVFLNVNKSLKGFERQRAGSFRKWLKTVTIRRCIDHKRKTGGEYPVSDEALLERYVSEEETVSEDLVILYDRAINLIENEFSARDLKIFLNVIVKGSAPSSVAEKEKVTNNVVYLVVSRVLKRLRIEFKELIEFQG